jgi:UDP-GlcNAc:undecaprenyl-phosphate GlcNAc-1-phosphate transferase
MSEPSVLVTAGRALGALLVSALMCALLLPQAARLAVRLGAVDQPGGRRLHRAPVPRLGGVAVVAATAVTCLLGALFGGLPEGFFQNPQNVALLAGAALVFAVGLVDDVRGASPQLKLVVQVVAALLVVGAGGLAERVALVRGVPALPLDGLMPLLLLLWIVGVTNAFNLIDGLDGLAAVCAVVALATMVVSGGVLDQATTFVFVAALLGALLAFLRRNWHPATMFLGDAGSMTLGFVLAVRAISSASGQDGTLHALVPLAALAYPVLDTATAILRRWLRGHSFSRADGRHIHHQMVTIGMSVPRAVRVLGAVGVAVSLGGLTVSFAPPAYTVAAAVTASLAASVAALYGIWRLEYSEFIALGKAIYSGLARSRRVVRERIRMADLARQVKRAASEPVLRECLRELVDFEHVRRAELVDPVELAAQPRGTGGAPPSHEETTIRLECPVRRTATGRVLRLRVWVTSHGVAHHTIQRVQHILCPELERWFERHDARVGRDAAAGAGSVAVPSLPEPIGMSRELRA